MTILTFFRVNFYFKGMKFYCKKKKLDFTPLKWELTLKRITLFLKRRVIVFLFSWNEISLQEIYIFFKSIYFL